MGSIASVLNGVLLLGRGRAEGMNGFGTGRDAVLSALAPYLALLGIATLAIAAQHRIETDMTRVLLMLCTLLVRPVVSQWLAVRFGREGLWSRYASASLWAEWLVQILVVVVFLVLQQVAPDLSGSRPVVAGIMTAFQCYELWLAWFIARAGLVLTRMQAVGMVVAVAGSVVALSALAYGLPPHYNALADMMAPLS